ncbi:MAG: alpha/beta hydrolase [Proteobacteria bacterium]|nr:alpha/beta hydrolase [Pseudomonadota bacterium]
MILRLLLSLINALPIGVFDLLYMGRPLRIDGLKINNKARFLCHLDSKSAKPLSETPLEEVRASMEVMAPALAGKKPKVAEVQNITFETPAGSLPARLYKPEPNSTPPVLIYFHGGGYIRGSLDSHDVLCRKLAAYGSFAVFSVDYRLAPENRFPAAVEDASAALNFMAEEGGSLGLDTSRIAIGGDSSGGCLAAVAAQLAKQNGTALPAFQLLLYPTMDAHLTAESHKLFADGFFLSHERIQAYRDMYLNSAQERDDYRASPLLNPDLAGLPPALIITAGFDPLRDEAESYGSLLQKAGVPMGLVRFPGMVHGFMSLTAALPEADKALKQAAMAVSHAFQPSETD